jgi:hypothetical protein
MSGTAQPGVAPQGVGQPGSASATPPEVRIDRLVLDIPGFDPAEARALAMGIADGLAKAGATGAHASVSVRLAAAHGPSADLAARIVAALVERLV